MDAIRYRYRRWLDLFAYAVIAAAVALLMHSEIPRAVGVPVRVSETMPTWLFCNSVAVLLLVPLALFMRGRWKSAWSFSYHLLYPPLRVSVGFACILVVLGLSVIYGPSAIIDSADVVLDFCVTASPAVAAIVVMAAIDRALVRDKKNHDRPESNTSETNPFRRRLIDNGIDIEWIESDAPIDTAESDHFGANVIATRMAERLAQSDSGGPPPTIAVVGPAGSGKSTLKNLVGLRLTKRSGVVFVDLSLWPFKSVDAAVEGVLSAIIESLSSRVSTIALRGLPKRYVRAIGGGGFGSTIASLCVDDHDPARLLQRIEMVLNASGLRLVVWIEDLERFGEDNRASPIREQNRNDIDMVGPIHSLLYLLDQCARVSVVLASVNLGVCGDIGKMARYVESPPALSLESVIEVIDRVRDAYFRGASNNAATGWIDPAHDEQRREMGRPVDSQDFELWGEIEEESKNVCAHIANLLRSPRQLKMCLRNIVHVFERLEGEIDFDSVFAIAAIRARYPQIFAILNDRIGEVARSFLDLDPKSTPGSFAHMLSNIVDAEASVDERASVWRLLRWLFPSTSVGQIELTEHVRRRPQGLFRRSQDYWYRYIATPDLDNDHRDQTILQVMTNESRFDELPDLLTKPRMQSCFLAFSDLLDMDRLYVVFEQTLQWYAAKPHPQELGGLSPIREVLQKRSRETQKDRLVQLMVDLCATNLPAAIEVWQLICEPPGSVLRSDGERDLGIRALENLVCQARVDARQIANSARGGDLRCVHEFASINVNYIWQQNGPRTQEQIKIGKDIGSMVNELISSSDDELVFMGLPFVVSEEADPVQCGKAPLWNNYVDPVKVDQLKRKDPPENAPDWVRAMWKKL